MDPRLQRRVQRYGWDRAAESYDTYWQRQLAPAHERLFELADFAEGEDVLDVACGTGMASIPAAEAVGSSGSLLGTDISQVMVESADAITSGLGLENTRFARMGAEALDVENGGFDAAICALGLMYVPEPVAALEEMYRSLKPGGRCVVAVWGERRNCGWAGIFPVMDARVSTEVCPMFFRLGTGETLARAFEQAGFENVSTDRIDSRLEYDDVDQALGAAFVGGPVAMA